MLKEGGAAALMGTGGHRCDRSTLACSHNISCRITNWPRILNGFKVLGNTLGMQSNIKCKPINRPKGCV